MEKFDLPLAAWLVFLGSALLEVGGDAVVRRGLRGANVVIILAGGLMLAGYGLLVNTVRWDFSRLLGVYVAMFATGERDVRPICLWRERAEFDMGGPRHYCGRRHGHSVRLSACRKGRRRYRLLAKTGSCIRSTDSLSATYQYV